MGRDADCPQQDTEGGQTMRDAIGTVLGIIFGIGCLAGIVICIVVLQEWWKEWRRPDHEQR